MRSQSPHQDITVRLSREHATVNNESTRSSFQHTCKCTTGEVDRAERKGNGGASNLTEAVGRTIGTALLQLPAMYTDAGQDCLLPSRAEQCTLDKISPMAPISSNDIEE